MPEFNIPPRREGIYIQMPKADLEMVLAMLRNPANADKQGAGALFNTGSGRHGYSGYCCLGAMQCAKTGGKVEYRMGDGRYRGMPTLQWLNSVGWRFFSVLGGETTSPYLPAFTCGAVRANDALGKTFAEIADAIEACAEGY